MKSKNFSLQSFFSQPMVRWWIVGLFFTAINIPLLYVFQDILKFPLWLGSALSSEIVTIWRFFANDYWVFSHPRPTWKRFWQYHVANFGSFVVWLSVTNLLPIWGMHYILASIIATACSVGLSMATNFFWIWRHKHHKKDS